MSERTPQDVLRELRRLSDNAPKLWWQPEPASPGRSMPAQIEVREIVDAAIQLIDKAIAEAPDSPPKSGDIGRYLPTDADLVPHDYSFLDEGVPDTLSEKPGLDVERLRLAMEAAWPSHTEGSGGTGRSIQASWRVTDPALPSTYLANRVSREYDRLGSTDSEGR